MSPFATLYDQLLRLYAPLETLEAWLVDPRIDLSERAEMLANTCNFMRNDPMRQFNAEVAMKLRNIACRLMHEMADKRSNGEN